MVLARLGLGVTFISSVADRFGAWGAHGTTGVLWGDFQHFISYTETLIPFAPKVAAALLAWGSTVLESALGLGLLLGLRTRTMAFVSGCLLFVSACATALSSAGLHAVLASFILGAFGGAMLLAFSSDDAA